MPGLNCSAFENSLMELARQKPLDPVERAALAAHLESCNACRTALDRQMRLSEAARALAADAADYSAPPQVERALLAELHATSAVPGGFQRRRFVYGVLGGAIAASLAVVWALSERPAPKIAVASNKTPAAVAATTQTPSPMVLSVAKPHRRRLPKPAPKPEPEQPFIAIPYTLPLEPYERAAVVRMDLPVAALIAAGLPTSMMDPAERVQTDVLVGQDGSAKAVRLVSLSTSN